MLWVSFHLFCHSSSFHYVFFIVHLNYTCVIEADIQLFVLEKIDAIPDFLLLSTLSNTAAYKTQKDVCHRTTWNRSSIMISTEHVHALR